MEKEHFTGSYIKTFFLNFYIKTVIKLEHKWINEAKQILIKHTLPGKENVYHTAEVF